VEASESCAEAVVLAGAECQVWVRVPGELEAVGVGDGVGVAVSCAEEDEAVLACGIGQRSISSAWAARLPTIVAA
jgi:hypothetical protein